MVTPLYTPAVTFCDTRIWKERKWRVSRRQHDGKSSRLPKHTRHSHTDAAKQRGAPLASCRGLPRGREGLGHGRELAPRPAVGRPAHRVAVLAEPIGELLDARCDLVEVHDLLPPIALDNILRKVHTHCSAEGPRGGHGQAHDCRTAHHLGGAGAARGGELKLSECQSQKFAPNLGWPGSRLPKTFNFSRQRARLTAGGPQARRAGSAQARRAVRMADKVGSAAYNRRAQKALSHAVGKPPDACSDPPTAAPGRRSPWAFSARDSCCSTAVARRRTSPLMRRRASSQWKGGGFTTWCGRQTACCASLPPGRGQARPESQWIRLAGERP